MAKIPDEELDQIKTGIDLAALVRSKGIELKKHGSKDLVGLSPFTDEKTPSFIVTPGKNLWHCMSSGQGGSVIDFVMKHDGVSFRHAVLLLKEQNPHLFGLRPGSGQQVGVVQKSTVPRLESPIDLPALSSSKGGDQALLRQVLSYYRSRLQESPAALDYLKSRGITQEAIKAFGIGYADRTLGLRLPKKDRKDGEEIRSRLTELGIYRETGHEHFNGCVVFPIFDKSGSVAEIYGRKIVQKQKTGIYHLYLPGPHRGIWNPDCFTLSESKGEIILCESIIDALTFWVNGFKNVTCIYGTEGFTDDHLTAFKAHQTQKIYLAYDRDKAGDRAAERDAERLQSHGIDCHRIRFPSGMDANQYALKMTPACAEHSRSASQSLKALIVGSEWLGSSSRKAELRPTSEHKSPKTPSTNSSTVPSSLAANPACAGQEEATKNKKDVEVVERGEDYEIALGDRAYRIRGLQKNTSFEVLKVNLRLMCNGPASSGTGLYYLDTLDLYRAKERGHFIGAAASETNLEPDLIKRDLGKVLLALEELQEKRIRAELESRDCGIEIPPTDREAALELLQSPDLLSRILSDFDACGIVGESTNKLTGYLAAVSRKLDKPLAIIVQSTSAAGKTALMESVLAMMPEEERIKYSAMTGQSLYYLGETNLKNKILAIVEEEGAEKASYALKLLQSEGELTIASTGKDEQGRMKTEEYHVEGPVMIFLTTTAIDIDEELLNRCLVLTVDESREQTKAIHDLQREAETFDGLKRKIERDRILSVHRNAQRLLKPLHVVNPYAKQLTFLSDRTRTRRDHMKYLTLIRTITLLHQYQRPVQNQNGLEYIEVTREDITAANRLAHEVLGRSLDELPPQTRRLLGLIENWVDEVAREKGLDRSDYHFSRRALREKTGWGDTQLKVHLSRLVELEYLLVHRNPAQWQGYLYELIYDGGGKSGERFLPGLIEIADLKGEKSGGGRGPVGPRSVGGRSEERPVLSSNQAGLGVNGSNRPEIAQEAHCLSGVVSPHLAGQA
jgi:DNA primase catalytic core